MMCLGIAVGFVVTFTFVPAVLLLMNRGEPTVESDRDLGITRLLSGVAQWRSTAVLAFSAIKLLLFPAAIWVAITGLVPTSNADHWTFGAATPTGAMAMSLAVLYDIRTATIAQILVWTSLLSLVTLALLA